MPIELMGPIAGLRVLLVLQYGRMGGTRTYARQLVEFYVRQKANFLVVRQGPPADLEMDEFLEARGAKFVEWDSISPVRPPMRLRGSGPNHLRRVVREDSEALQALAVSLGVDFVVASVGDPGSLLGSMNAAAQGIYILHTYPHGLRSWILSRLLLPTAFPLSAQLVTVSAYARERVVKEWKLGSRLSDVHVLYSTVGQLIERASSATESPTVLTVGHLEGYKDPLGWVEMAASVLASDGLEESQFIWAGDGSMMAECLRAVERRGIQDQVHFVGMQKDLEMLYRCCAVYFQPSRVESLGLGVLDAARRGIPAVVSDVGGLPEAVDSGRSGIVYPVHNPNVAVDSLVTLLKDVDRRKEMGNRARDHYAARFTPMKWEAALLKLHMTPPQGTAEAAPSTVDS